MDTTIPARAPEPPSKRQLAVATGIAFITAAVILVTAVLPAEYGIDPLGTGAAMGLRAGCRIKRSTTEDTGDTEE
jgi:hypothetical protein